MNVTKQIISIDNMLQTITNQAIGNARSFQFNTSDLPPINGYQHDIRGEKVFKEIFQQLDAIDKHCLYWFKTDDHSSTKQLVDTLEEARVQLKNDKRTVPPKNKNINSDVLYLGIRRGGFTKKHHLSYLSGRIIGHLGHYHVGTTQGLQLMHWARNTNIKISLNITAFEGLEEYHYLLNTIEKIAAKGLKPLLGRH